MTDHGRDGWGAGTTYEDFMGRWSRPLSEEFVRWLGLPRLGHWLDVGTGTGALATAILAIGKPASVLGCDPSGPFIEAARKGLADPRVTFEVSGTGSLPKRRGGYDAVVSGLSLNFFPDPGEAIEEQLGLTRRGGTVGAFVWDYAEGMEFLRLFWDVAAAIEPEAAEMDEGRRFSICNPGSMEFLFRSAGAESVRVTSLTVPTRFPSFDAYWRPFLGGTGPAPSLLSSLPESTKEAMAHALAQRLPIRNDGSIELTARAWAVAGKRC
jgi:SAM-dependent methyltransferase